MRNFAPIHYSNYNTERHKTFYSRKMHIYRRILTLKSWDSEQYTIHTQHRRQQKIFDIYVTFSETKLVVNDGRRRGKQVNKLSLLMMIDEADKDDSVVVQLTCLRPYLDLISVLFYGHRGIACAHIPYSEILALLTVDCYLVIQRWRTIVLEQVPVILPSVTVV